MVYNRSVYHVYEDRTMLALRCFTFYKFLLRPHQVLTTHLLCSNSARPRHTSFELQQNLVKTSMSIATSSLRSYHVLTTSFWILGRGKDVVGTWSCVNVVLKINVGSHQMTFIYFQTYCTIESCN